MNESSKKKQREANSHQTGGKAKERRAWGGGEDEAWLGSVRARRAGRLRGLQGGVGRLESALFALPPPVELPMVSATPASPLHPPPKSV